jgi:hypothetical protein
MLQSLTVLQAAIHVDLQMPALMLTAGGLLVITMNWQTWLQDCLLQAVRQGWVDS